MAAAENWEAVREHMGAYPDLPVEVTFDPAMAPRITWRQTVGLHWQGGIIVVGLNDFAADPEHGAFHLADINWFSEGRHRLLHVDRVADNIQLRPRG